MIAPAYYREIDGLRAVSVILILLFHLQFYRVSGGFVGVDVFFVISGFLITRLILRGLAGGEFSFREFYLRRLLRLLPALLVTVLVSLLVAAWLMSPLALMHAAREGLAALFSVSNIFFWMESGYWAPKAKNFLLLHTWSLGVEEQFYLVYPLLLFAVYHLFARRGVIGLVLLMLVIGSLASALMLPANPAAAFYLTPLRLHEFAVGGLAALLPAWRPASKGSLASASVLTLAGLCMILYSALTFSFLTPFPGFNSLLPAVGAMLVILAGGSAVATLLLSNPVMIWLGRLSYSVYLVHWPVIVLYRYASGPSLVLQEQLGLLALTLLLAVALNIGVEQRFRLAAGAWMTRTAMPARHALGATALGAGLVCSFAVVLITAQGLPSRYPQNLQRLALQDVRVLARSTRISFEQQCIPRRKMFCGRRREGQTNIMLLADSRGPDIYAALRTAYPQANIRASYAMGCAPVFNPNIGRSIHYAGCPQLNRRRLKAALRAPRGEVVFLAMNLNQWRAKYALETAERLVASGKRVYVLGESRFIEGKSPRDIAIDQHRLAAGPEYIEHFVVRQPFSVDQGFAAQFEAAGATYVSARDFFHPSVYRLFTRDKRDLLSYDGLHLTQAGAEEFGQYLARQFPLQDD